MFCCLLFVWFVGVVLVGWFFLWGEVGWFGFVFFYLLTRKIIFLFKGISTPTKFLLNKRISENTVRLVLIN